MQIHRLIAHPAMPPRKVAGVSIAIHEIGGDNLLLRWRIDGAQEVVLPPFAGRGRADDLWKTTCFELFVGRGNGAYREFNFSPSGQWAAYDFTAYRRLAGNTEMREGPLIEVQRGESIITATVGLPRIAVEGAKMASLCAVIEEGGGNLSFWSNAHNKDKPDFHDPDCFALTLAAPLAP